MVRVLCGDIVADGPAFVEYETVIILGKKISTLSGGIELQDATYNIRDLTKRLFLKILR